MDYFSGVSPWNLFDIVFINASFHQKQKWWPNTFEKQKLVFQSLQFFTSTNRLTYVINSTCLRIHEWTTVIQYTYSSWISVEMHIHHNTKQNLGSDHRQTAKNKKRTNSHFCSKYVSIKMGGTCNSCYNFLYTDL